MLIAEFMTKTGPIYVNTDHVIYFHQDDIDPKLTHIHLTLPEKQMARRSDPRHDMGHITVEHSPVDVVLRLYKGME